MISKKEQQQREKKSNEKLLTHATMHDVSSAVSHNLHPAAHYSGRKIIKKRPNFYDFNSLLFMREKK